MQKKQRLFLSSFLVLAALLVSTITAGFAFAKEQSPNGAQASPPISAKPATAKLVAMHTVNMGSTQAETPKSASHHTALPFLTGVSPSVYAQRKAAAAHAKNAPILKYGNAPTDSSSNDPNTPPATANFQGMADSASICPYFGGCQPPDMAIAASTQWVFQGVNTSYAVYDTSGHIQAGWPKNSQVFFNVPNPPNNCDPHGPFLSDPRALYDVNDGRFWAATLQVEGAFGIAPGCPFQTLYWIGVSQTSDPNGMWNIYAFDMSLGTTNGADYTQVGIDAHAFYFGGNMFNQPGTAYEYDEIFAANKQAMEAGKSVTAFGFSKLTVGGVFVDTVQPVQSETPSYAGPPDGLFVNTFNMDGDPNGNDCASSPCSGIVVWAMTHPGTSHEKLMGTEVSTSNYLVPPNADQPGCSQCVETIDTRITATPVLANGTISWSIDTAVMNKTQVVPAIFWGQVTPQIANGILKGALLYQSGYFGFQGDQDASFGAMMPDENGNLIMIYDTMSSSLNPSTAYAGRRSTFPLGRFHDAGKFLQKGLVPTGNSRWGDYESTSYDGFSSDNIWMASQYSGSNADWATVIGETKFVIV